MVPVPGGRLCAIDDGEGPAVLLLHAGIADLRAWNDLVPLLVARGHRVVRYDARGFGRSETEDVVFSNRGDAIAVLDAFGIGRACLVGNSRGGAIAVDTAVEYPDRVAAVVTLGASVGGLDIPTAPAEDAMWAEEERLEAAGDLDATVDFDLRTWVDGPGQSPDRFPAALRASVREMARAAEDPDRPRGRPIPLDPPAGARLADLAMPILALAGALDVSDRWPTALALAASCPRGRAELVPDVAHMIAMEAPGLVAVRIADLLRPPGAFD
jgi:pimeloyl-ACP methyl ester carboxylesterase